MSLHKTLERFGTSVSVQVLRLWQRWQEGKISEAEFRSLARAVLVRAGARSAALADAAVAAALTALTRRPVPTSGVSDPGEPIDAQEAVAETLSSVSYERDPEAAVKVLGAAFVYERFQKSFGQGMRDQGVQYWRRVPEPGSCEVCEDLSEGMVSTDVDMWHHKGCRCVAEPVIF